MRTIITLGSIGILIVIVAFWAIGLSNKYNTKYQTGKAIQSESEVTFDKVWKTISSQAKVTEQYKDGFKEVYVEMMEARYSDDGQGQESFMKWVQESNPTFDPGLYKTLMNTIDGEREAFLMAQKKLIDIDRELKTMKVTWPASWIIGGKPDLDIKLVTSGKTKEAFSTGEENDVNPFN